MTLKRALSVLAVVCVLIVAVVAWQRQRASPHETIEATIGGKKVTITYGRPSLKGRKAVGDSLVPYVKVWRTGADEATILTTEADLMIGSLAVPKGSYSLFTLPTETGWKLIVNKTDKQWGAFTYKEADDLGRTDMKVGKTAATVEQFTISLATAGSGGVMKLEWENTSASVDVKLK